MPLRNEGRRAPLPALCLLLAGSLTGCASATNWLAGEPPPAVMAEMRDIASPGLVGRGSWAGAVSNAQSASFLVARTEAEWRALWDLVGQPPPAKLPDRLMALAVFLGTRTTAGYGVEIVDVRLERRPGQRDRLLVRYRETEPPPGGARAQMLTSPYTIVMVDRSEAAARYSRVP
ncbi:protease complex subunit PrcB family protein [Rhodocista pekingensis]|uniref:Protease complex subunit PrcB family protein n=1 Tax=Rhodocista pekingensis TaxID=201185 RepID=A0ABW2KRJ1_9PROT